MEPAAPYVDAVKSLDALVSWRVPFQPSAVGAARTHVASALRRVGVPKRVVEDSRLVVTELLGNALRHARPTDAGCLRLTLRVLPDSVRLAVSDGGSATIPRRLDPPALATSGRGLGIVGTLTREWGVVDEAGGNTVFGVLSLTDQSPSR